MQLNYSFKDTRTRKSLRVPPPRWCPGDHLIGTSRIIGIKLMPAPAGSRILLDPCLKNVTLNARGAAESKLLARELFCGVGMHEERAAGILDEAAGEPAVWEEDTFFVERDLHFLTGSNALRKSCGRGARTTSRSYYYLFLMGTSDYNTVIFENPGFDGAECGEGARTFSVFSPGGIALPPCRLGGHSAGIGGGARGLRSWRADISGLPTFPERRVSRVGTKPRPTYVVAIREESRRICEHGCWKYERKFQRVRHGRREDFGELDSCRCIFLRGPFGWSRESCRWCRIRGASTA